MDCNYTFPFDSLTSLIPFSLITLFPLVPNQSEVCVIKILIWFDLTRFRKYSKDSQDSKEKFRFSAWKQIREKDGDLVGHLSGSILSFTGKNSSPDLVLHILSKVMGYFFSGFSLQIFFLKAFFLKFEVSIFNWDSNASYLVTPLFK